MVFLFLQIRYKFSDGVQFTVSISVRRETGSARQNNSVKSGTKILPSCEQTHTHCRWFEWRKVSCHKYNRWTKIISDTLSSPPPNNVVSRHLQQQTYQHRSGGGGSRLYVFPNSPFGDSVCGERFFGWFVGYTWVVRNRNACQLVVTNVSTTCADVIITAIVTNSHQVAVYVFCVFFTDAILSLPFSWPSSVTRSNPNLLLPLKHINTCMNSNN